MKIPRISAVLFPLLASAVVMASAPSSATAETAREYEVASNDGYGLEDCLAEGSSCGQAVADAWCQAHGHGHALAYGRRSAVDGLAASVAASDEPYVIKCGD